MRIVVIDIVSYFYDGLLFDISYAHKLNTEILVSLDCSSYMWKKVYLGHHALKRYTDEKILRFQEYHSKLEGGQSIGAHREQLRLH